MIFREKHGKKWNRPHSLMAAFFIFGLFLYGCGSSSSGNNVGVVPVDTDPPTVPQNLTAVAVSATQINLAWEASTDNKGVVGYKIYRDNIDLVSTTGTSYNDTGLSEGVTYSYEVSAYDLAQNESDRSLAAQASTISTGVTGAVDVFLDEILPDENYTKFHGSTSNDGTKMLVTVNVSDSPFGAISGVMDLYMLDAKELEKGKAVLLYKGQVAGDHSGPMAATNAFRSSWTPDDSKIMFSAGDRVFILDAGTLEPLNGEMGDTGIGGHTHDILTTSDGKYGVLTIRTKPYSGDDASKMDGELQLYDAVNGEAIGASVSVCNACHGQATPRNSVLCGLDGVLTLQGDGTYTGKVYVAGESGHMAEADLAIDPSDTANPITITGGPSKLTISMVKFAGGDSQYKLHDARLDTATNTLYWSTFNADANGQVHYGKVDLATKSVTDVAYDVTEKVVKPQKAGDPALVSLYCASGQTQDYFMPITMTHPSYITVIPKASITESSPPPPNKAVKVATNVFLDEIHPSKNYNMFHGSTSPDGTKMLITVNEATAPGAGPNGAGMGSITGTIALYMLNTSELEKGKAALVTTGAATASVVGADTTKTVGFRSTWTPDGSKIAFAGGDRFWVLDAQTLQPLNHENGDKGIGGENHDALPTTDGKYALLTVRTGNLMTGPKDGKIQLYDMVKGEAVGGAVSVCNSCHGYELDSTLCGLDGELAYDGAPGYGGAYKGTVYVAGHGGHFAQVELSIDPTAVVPITIVNNKKLPISNEKFAPGEPGAGSSTHKLHDGRLDGNTLYWSTYNTDKNGKVRYGKIDLTTKAVTNVQFAVDERATIPDRSVEPRNKMPMYCASGQTSRVFMPITMTNEAYITVIPKLGIK